MKFELQTTNNQSSLIDNQLEMPSTPVENIRQIRLFMQNKPNFPHFSSENDDFAKKQTQYKPNSNPIKTNFGPISSVAKPNKAKNQLLLINLCHRDNRLEGKAVSKPIKRQLKKIFTEQNPVRKPRSLRIKKLTIRWTDDNLRFEESSSGLLFLNLGYRNLFLGDRKMQSYIKLLVIIILTSLVSIGLARETAGSGEAGSMSFPYMAEVAGDDLYVRSGPGTNFYYCSKLNKGDEVKVVGKQFSWARILPPPGSFSWISMQYVSIDPADPKVGTVTGDKVRVYAGSDNVEPLHSTTLQGKLDRGDKVTLLGEQMDDYYKIAPPSFAYLWVSVNFTKPLPVKVPETVTPAAEPSTTKTTAAEESKTVKPPETEPEETPKETTPEPASPETLLEKYEALQEQVQAERAKPIEKQNYTEIKKALIEITGNENAGKAARYAEHVLKQIKDLELVLAVDKEVRLQNEQLKTIREKIQKSRAARKEKFEDLGSYAVIGRLQTFTTYGPGNYRIVDDSGKTVCYALPNGPISQIELSNLIGLKVGLVGTIEPHKQTKGVLVRFTKVVKLD
jgi:uncharacterized protein YgiM (DUF1202 family)